jgi:nitrite reductase (NADH) large subunit
MWGGLTTPAELRASPMWPRSTQVPTVKVTGGQRIDLLGVKKDDLPAMWADLGMRPPATPTARACAP